MTVIRRTPSPPPIPPVPADPITAAAIAEVRATVIRRLGAHPGNRELADLCLDVLNILKER